MKSEWYKEKDEHLLQRKHGRRLSMQDTNREIESFLRDQCDWILLAGNRITMKVASDRYSKSGGYITQKKVSGEDGRPETEYHNDFDEAVSYAQRQISNGG